jgi:asparagine synthase (glutamine-hydrolysing)
MTSVDGRYTTVFNGEIYNYREIRRDLKGLGFSFRGTSDTEVILSAAVQWGIEETLRRMSGMFALAIWDKTASRLYLARDRMGEKPLYYGWSGGVFLFGSELKALRAHPRWQGVVNRNALTLLLRHGYVPAPHSIYEGIKKLRPGTVVVFDGTHRDGVESAYWSARDHIIPGGERATLSDAAAVSALDEMLHTVIRQQMISDVPLGAFLSGGVDSSTIVGIMQSLSSQPVRTFTIGFEENAFNEAVHAKAVARHIGTDHTELYVTPNETLNTIPNLPGMYDEPFADSSQVPTFLVAQLARRHVTVSLSGDGGDELFGGYPRYSIAKGIWNLLGWMPRSMRYGVGHALESASPEQWDLMVRKFRAVLPRGIREHASGDRAHKLAAYLRAASSDDLYVGLVSQWQSPNDLVVGGKEPPTPLTSDQSGREHWDLLTRLMYLDMISYLPDDILVKVDRATMAVSLESRAPFLDHRVVELALGLPLSVKFRDGQSKWILRRVLEKYVPPSLFERPKMGFGIPLDRWLRGPLREWAGDLLAPARLRREGYLRPEQITEKWNEHQSGTRNWQHLLWSVLMFQAWLEAERGSGPPQSLPGLPQGALASI